MICRLTIKSPSHNGRQQNRFCYPNVPAGSGCHAGIGEIRKYIWDVHDFLFSFMFMQLTFSERMYERICGKRKRNLLISAKMRNNYIYEKHFIKTMRTPQMTALYMVLYFEIIGVVNSHSEKFPEEKRADGCICGCANFFLALSPKKSSNQPF